MENNEFVWTDDLIIEMIWNKLPLTEYYKGNVQKCLDDFKRYKSSQSEKYKILEFQRVSTGEVEWVWNGDAYGYMNVKSGYSHFKLDELIGSTGSGMGSTVKNGEIKIFTVERLSDGEIFSVGDRIEEGIIQSFRMNYGNNLCWVSTDDEKDYGCALSVAKKAPIFYITEDGVKMQEGSDMVSLDIESWEIVSASFEESSFRIKHFSTLKAAEAYKLLNKPQFSLNDIIKIKNESRCLGDTLLEELYKIAEAKTNSN